MPQPKKKMSNTRSGNRRSHLSITEVTLVTCSKCKSPVKPHEICKLCGYFGGNQVIDVEKKEKRLASEIAQVEEVK